MASYDVTSPDGRKFRVNAPDDATQEQVLAYAQANMPAAPKPEDPGVLQSVAIGAGRSMDKLAAGLRNITPSFIRDPIDSLGRTLGMADGAQIEAQQKAADEAYAPLAKKHPIATTVGEALPYLTSGTPLLMGGMAALEYGTPQERLQRGALAYAGGKAGEWVGGKVAGALERRAASRAEQLASQQAENAVRDQTIKIGQDLGYAFPPSQINPTPLNRAVEGFAGKLTTAQQASVMGQSAANKAFRRELGLAADTPLTPAVLQQVRAEAHAAGYVPVENFGTISADKTYAQTLLDLATKYDKSHGGMKALQNPEIEGILRDANQASFDSSNVVSLLRNLREQGFANKAPMSSAKDRALGDVQIKLSNAIEGLTERNLEAAGQQGALNNFRAARKLIAKSFTAEKALNPATGNIDAHKVAAMWMKKAPLEGDMLNVAKVAKAFPALTREMKTSLPGLSPLDYMGGIMGSGAAGPVGGLAMFARPFVRAGILSEPYQRAMVQAPSYTPGLADQLLAKAGDNPEAMKRLGGLLGLAGPQASP